MDSVASLRFLFIVQGEGRGHITQAISLNEILKANGHKVVSVIVGTSNKREIPSFFTKHFDFSIVKIASPNFITKNFKSLRILPSILYNLTLIPRFIKDTGIIHKEIQKHKPDIIINFYEPLVGVYNMLYNSSTKMISIAHQFTYQHEHFVFPQSNWFDRLSVKLVTFFAGYKSDKRIALSFYDMPPSKDKNLIVVPPLLRSIVFEHLPKQGDFLLVYLLNAGYAEEIISWHRLHQEVKIECFVDRMDFLDNNYQHPNLVFLLLDDKKFIEKLSTCKGFMTSAGFESVCEAVYLDKPVFMVPVANHFEQYCNSIDAQRINAGITSNQFDIDRFILYIENNPPKSNERFKQWVDSFKELLEALILD